MEYILFNPDYLMNVSGGDRDIMEEIVSIFRSQMPEFLATMKELNEEGKHNDLGLLAHKAKGSVTVMGMEATARMLKEFELEAKAGLNPEGYPGFIARFEADTATVMAEIDDFMKKR